MTTFKKLGRCDTRSNVTPEAFLRQDQMLIHASTATDTS